MKSIGSRRGYSAVVSKGVSIIKSLNLSVKKGPRKSNGMEAGDERCFDRVRKARENKIDEARRAMRGETGWEGELEKD